MVGGILALVHRGRVGEVIRLAGWPAVLAGVCSSASSVFFILALGRVTVANATFMGGITPFLAAIGAQAFLGERVPRRAWGAMGLAATGVTLMLGGGLALGQLSGNLLALGSAVSFAGHALFLRFNRQSDMLPAVLYAGIFGMLFGLLAIGVGGLSPRVPLRDLGLATAMGVVQLGGGLVLYTRASRYLPAAELQLVATAELVMAPLWVWIGRGRGAGRRDARRRQPRHPGDPAAGHRRARGAAGRVGRRRRAHPTARGAATGRAARPETRLAGRGKLCFGVERGHHRRALADRVAPALHGPGA